MVQDNIAGLAIDNWILNHFLVRPIPNEVVLLQKIQNLSLVMVALDYVLLAIELLENPDPLFILVGPNHIPENVDCIIWINRLIPELNHIMLHVDSICPRTIVIAQNVFMVPVAIAYVSNAHIYDPFN
jgi:hypothetical protein